MTTQFILARHGQTEWNRIERFRGRANIYLNETGIEQAKRAGTRLALEKIDVIYSSPLSRTMRTAEFIAARHGLAVQAHPALNDIDYGLWQGWTPDEAAQREPETYRLWLHSPERVTFPNGESLHDVRERAIRALETWTVQHEAQTVLLVSHKIVCKVILCAVLGLDVSAIYRIEQDNAATNRFEYRDGMFVVTSINNMEHLR